MNNLENLVPGNVYPMTTEGGLTAYYRVEESAIDGHYNLTVVDNPADVEVNFSNSVNTWNRLISESHDKGVNTSDYIVDLITKYYMNADELQKSKDTIANLQKQIANLKAQKSSDTGDSKQTK